MNQSFSNNVKVLAIDPGFERVGIAVIEKSMTGKHLLLYSSCFKTKAVLPFHERLALIGKEIEKTIKEYGPSVMAIEKLYLSTNHKSVMGVAEARGVIVYSASCNNLDIYEYTPPQIKIAVTGYGRADKSMVIKMVPKLIEMKTMSKSDDELDAIAIGLTCLASQKYL